MSTSLLSVGIDVGTTTSQLVFSQLEVANSARPGQTPRIEIAAKRLLYQSPIIFTPLQDAQTIDTAAVLAWVQTEYQNAGFSPAQVATGAVIITGETAKKHNAAALLAALGKMAGEFVVTVAGPKVEALLAGRGAGAAHYARTHFTPVTNIDIGGGTANAVTFEREQWRAAALNIGGRLVEIDAATAKIRHIAPPAQPILATCGINWAVGAVPTLGSLRQVADCLAALIVELLQGSASPLAQQLYLTPPTPMAGPNFPLMFSGGVGHYFYQPTAVDTVTAIARHGDIGPLFAAALRQQSTLNTYPILPPTATQRATVLGASAQTLALSGSTIWADMGLLPLRNLPVVSIHLELANSPDTLAQTLQAALGQWDMAPTEVAALALEFDGVLRYAQLQQLALALKTFATTLLPQQPLILVLEHDYAQALGQMLKTIHLPNPLLVIDGVKVQAGDTLDLGTPLLNNRVIPLTLKTLIFYH